MGWWFSFIDASNRGPGPFQQAVSDLLSFQVPLGSGVRDIGSFGPSEPLSGLVYVPNGGNGRPTILSPGQVSFQNQFRPGGALGPGTLADAVVTSPVIRSQAWQLATMPAAAGGMAPNVQVYFPGVQNRPVPLGLPGVRLGGLPVVAGGQAASAGGSTSRLPSVFDASGRFPLTIIVTPEQQLLARLQSTPLSQLTVMEIRIMAVLRNGGVPTGARPANMAQGLLTPAETQRIIQVQQQVQDAAAGIAARYPLPLRPPPGATPRGPMTLEEGLHLEANLELMGRMDTVGNLINWQVPRSQWPASVRQFFPTPPPDPPMPPTGPGLNPSFFGPQPGLGSTPPPAPGPFMPVDPGKPPQYPDAATAFLGAAYDAAVAAQGGSGGGGSFTLNG